MQKLSILLYSALIALLFVQCQTDTVTEVPLENTGADDVITVDQDITEDVTWVAGNIYVLDDLITVSDNATLTIEPCVLVKAANGATGLVIAKGAKLDAQGTSDCPIIFTSTEDMIQPGDIISPNLTGEDVGLWAGIFILGDAPVSTSAPSNIMPLLPQNPLHEFGGVKSDDNSGTLRYISIRHTGFETAPEETPSGLVLGGAGNGTTVDHIELFANADDGFLVVGGSVDVSDVVTTHFNDDGFDVDQGYSGVMDNLIGIGGKSNNSALELDGGEGTANPQYTIRNSSFLGSQTGEDYIDFQQKVSCIIENTYFFGFDADAVVKLDRDRDAENWLNELIDVTNLEFNTSHLTSGNTAIANIFFDAGSDASDAFAVRAPDAKVVSTPTTGANKSAFAGWTVADANGDLDDF